jgi:cytochrome P450
VIDGVTLPVGSTAAVFVHLLHRNPKVWDNPSEFDPERFLEHRFSPVQSFFNIDEKVFANP